MMLTMRTNIGKVLLSLLAVTIMGLPAVLEAVPPAGDAQATTTSSAAPKAAALQVVAYYFHGNFRCDNCRKIEQYSREAIEQSFPEELKSGLLAFKVLNTDESENSHFIKDYQLFTRSLVLAEFRNGMQTRWENLSKVWDHLDSQEAFHDYVRTEVQKYLEGR